ncbi:MAG: metallophosphoesterase [Candidatus Methanomethylicia archaeon]|nr:metallophosphoesterase [Candidatus Methanomethylicia archaeon]MCX8168897.1 metallophosphoesterase [Candidatus Methanomethylicia archaeon]MDW7988629.1 metallophosphoesterase [Nitrososphaerota archaeon]
MIKPVSPYAALTITTAERGKVLVISDTHIGWEASLAENKIHIPSQTGKLLKKLEEIIQIENPECLIILGDVKHTIEKIGLEEWREVPRFLENVKRIVKDVVIIPGNHDGDINILIPEGVKLEPQQGIIIDDIGLFHGHAWPDIRILNCRTMIIGHIHPIVVFRDCMGYKVTSQIWVKAPCNKEILVKAMFKKYKIKFKSDEEIDRILIDEFSIKPKVENLIVMPSFNDFLGGRAVNRISISKDEALKDFMGPILRSGSISIEEAEIYLLDGTFLGMLKQLTTIN